MGFTSFDPSYALVNVAAGVVYLISKNGQSADSDGALERAMIAEQTYISTRVGSRC